MICQESQDFKCRLIGLCFTFQMFIFYCSFYYSSSTIFYTDLIAFVNRIVKIGIGNKTSDVKLANFRLTSSRSRMLSFSCSRSRHDRRRWPPSLKTGRGETIGLCVSVGKSSAGQTVYTYTEMMATTKYNFTLKFIYF